MNSITIPIELRLIGKISISTMILLDDHFLNEAGNKASLAKKFFVKSMWKVKNEVYYTSAFCSFYCNFFSFILIFKFLLKYHESKLKPKVYSKHLFVSFTLGFLLLGENLQLL